jgi:hypothetical protein
MTGASIPNPQLSIIISSSDMMPIWTEGDRIEAMAKRARRRQKQTL